MLRSILTCVVVLFCLVGQPAYAAFGCDVLPSEDGFIVLRERPDARAAGLAEVPQGVVVSLFDEPADMVGEWVRVAYSVDQSAFWGAGQKGWVRMGQIGDCG